VVAGLYVAATIACIGLPAEPSVNRQPAGSPVRGPAEPLAELAEGIRTVRGDREISRPIIHQAAGASVAGVLGVLGPALATSVGLQPDHLVVIVLPLGIGVLLGVLGLRRFSRVAHRRAAEAGLLAFGGLTAVLAAIALARTALESASISPIPLLIAIALMSGAAYAVTSVSAQTALLESIPPEYRGRVFGVLASVVSAASLGPTMIAGPLADRISAPVVLLVVGAAVAGVATWSARSFGPLRTTANRPDGRAG